MRIGPTSVLVAAALVLAAASAHAKSSDPLARYRVRVINSYLPSGTLSESADIVPYYSQYLSTTGFLDSLCGDSTQRGVAASWPLDPLTHKYPEVWRYGPKARRRRLTFWIRQVSPTDEACMVEVLDETPRRLLRNAANLRIVHGVPSASTDDVRIGALGVGCLTSPLSYWENTVVTVPPGTYTLAVFAPGDVNCNGEPLAGLTARPVRFEPRTAYTAIAWVKRLDSGVQLRLQRDFCEPGCPVRDLDGDGLPPPR